MVNDRRAKAGTEISVGDIIAIGFGNRNLKLKILAVRDNAPAKLAAELYEILEDYRPVQDDGDKLC
jgi:ribosomal 50S subunit-recycling heat shock protein